jgi:ParB family chromosome partitioning protein
MTLSQNLEQLESDFELNLAPSSIKKTMMQEGASSRDLWQIDPSKLRVIEGLNPRVMNDQYRAHIRTIADSMKSEGYYQDQPMAGYVAKDIESNESVVYIYGGHTRLLAVKIAIEEGATILRVPVTVSQEGLSQEDITVALIRGNSGKNLSFYETAIVCKRLIKFGLTIEEITERTGINGPSIKNRLDLMASPFKLREMVANEIISATLAVEMIAKHGAKALEKIDEARESAANAGKTRITKNNTKNSQIVERTKFIKKSAPKLYEAATVVIKDPGYTMLTVETRQLIEDLLKEIKAKGSDQDTDTSQMKLDISPISSGNQA